MEPPAGCTVQSGTAGPPLDVLTHLFRCVQGGSSPGRSPAEAAAVVLSGLSGLLGGCGRVSGVEATAISVSLLEKITCCARTQNQAAAAGAYCQEVLKLLLQDPDLMSHLVRLFQTEDQILSHVASRSAAACVHFVLVSPGGGPQQGPVLEVWQQKCLQVFLGSAPGPELDACLWSLTDVFRRLLRGARPEIFGELLAAFDSAIVALCSRFLPADGAEASRRPMAPSGCRRWSASFCLLLDLLEVLAASRSMCGAAVCLRSQRLSHLSSSALLAAAASSSAENVARRRALLLLKRVVLQKAGDDWAPDLVLLQDSRPQRDQLLSADLRLLAHSVLTAVAADWLQEVRVGGASFFGGVRGGGGPAADGVALRAVALLLLKSTELHAADGAGGGAEASECFRRLMAFLAAHGVRRAEAHRCAWLKQLFSEQDDDLMEAAAASLRLFLRLRRGSGAAPGAAPGAAACSAGFDPHCHFLLLLRSVSFDHSVLLDFLISTETCFLEYFVRYLKLLADDRPGFAAACRRVLDPDAESGSRAAEETGGPGSGLRLVDYGSSEDSDLEPMDEPAAGLSRDQSDQSACETWSRTVRCLSELRAVVKRLHSRNLFPYNPSSLLKLLSPELLPAAPD
ncbi:uncharacterized protein V6R79_014880 [Siganus canaliculatus]